MELRKESRFAIALASAAALFGGTWIHADVKLPSVFASHMVLQQEKPLTVWGWADPGEAVRVELGSTKQNTVANAAGEWRITLPALQATANAQTLTVAGKNTLKLEDVLVGEVWLCSGQSNMEMGVRMCLDADKEVAAADYPQIRLFLVPKIIGSQPQRDVNATWKVCSPTTITEGGWNGFSASAYYFGRELHKTLKVPVGLIESSWGGSRIEPWTPPVGFAQVPALKGIFERVELADPTTEAHKQRLKEFIVSTEAWVAAAKQSIEHGVAAPAMPSYPTELDFNSSNFQTPTGLYNAMIHPLAPFAIRGAIWYQGEGNVGDGMLYTEKMKALIGGWREIWKEGDFPFYYVQICPYNYGGFPDNLVPELWEAQSAAMAIPNTGMAVTNDIGDVRDIHPRNKQEVGRRLALWALAKTYNQSGIIAQSPTFKSYKVEGSRMLLTFDHAGAGLQSRDGKPLEWFEVIDKETGGFVKAKAEIVAPNVVAVSADGVKNPAAVRFAWSQLAEPNLSSKEGLPANSFRAGEVPKRDAISLITEARDMKLVYDLDLKKLGSDIQYAADHHAAITGTIDRIAYMVELQGRDGENQYLYVSMDPFTTDLAKIGVPTVVSGAKFQQNVTNLNVISNVKGIVTGMGLKGGNIEFWPNDYGPGNSANVPNASGGTFDFGDQPGGPANGYGSMQVHNHDARQTLFAINHWSAGATADLGLGSRQNENTDWTFAGNAGSYLSGRLRVYVHVK